MSDDHHVRIRRILTKLDKVRHRRLKCFGSDTHRFELRSPASPADVEAFELERSIRLPADFRAFLTTAGDGGAGPYYGIFPLRQLADFAASFSDEPTDWLAAEPCPLHPEFPAPPTPDACLDPHLYQGTLLIGTRGCSYETLLIVVGEHTGRIVYVDADGSVPYVCRETDFLAWYERWLDELLAGYATDWFGYGPSGAEADFLRLLDDPASSSALRAEAVVALGRLPSLSPDAAARLPTYLQDADPHVRAGASRTVRSRKVFDAGPAVGRLLADPSPEVRREVVRTVMDLDPVRWEPAVRSRLKIEDDEDVATSAFYSLRKRGSLDKRFMVELLSRSPLSALRHGLANAIDWESRDRDLLVCLLADSEAGVRRHAVLGLRRAGAADAVADLLDLLRREQDAHVVRAILSGLGEFGDPTAVPALLEWAQSTDDFNRLDAVAALARMGEDCVLPIAEAMTLELRKPIRNQPDGSGWMSSIHSISSLVRDSLKQSPSPALRALAEKPAIHPPRE